MEIDATVEVWRPVSGVCATIEQNRISDPYTTEVARYYLASMLAQRIDTLVYGCTHSPHLAPVCAHCPQQCKLVDPAVHVVTAATQELDLLGLRNTHAPLPTRFYVSGCPQQFAQSSAVARLHTSG